MTINQQKENKAIETARFDLIRGDFLPEEASELINYLIHKKIEFHEVRNFSSQIRFGKDDEASKLRLLELASTQEDIQELVSEASKQRKTLRVRSTINIELI